MHFISPATGSAPLYLSSSPTKITCRGFHDPADLHWRWLVILPWYNVNYDVARSRPTPKELAFNEIAALFAQFSRGTKHFAQMRRHIVARLVDIA